MAFVFGDLICTGLIIVGLVALLFILLVPLVVEHRRGGKALAIAVVVVLIAGLTSYGGFLYLDYADWRDTQELEYHLNVTVDGVATGVLFAPVTVNLHLQHALRSDKATFAITGTERGTALRVEFEGNASVRGRFTTSEEAGDYHLTMLDEGHIEWTWYYWFGLGPVGNGTVSVELMMEFHSIDVDEWWWTERVLEQDWTSVKVQHEYMKWEY